MTEIINADLQKISEWFKANKLIVNPSKSNIIIIPPKLNHLPVTIKTYLNNTLIPQTSAANYLGITINTDLKFRNYIVLIELKISRTIGMLSKLRQFLPQSALLKIYYTLIHSQLMYGLPIWGSTFPSYINKLKSLQNKVVKTIGGGSSLESPTKFFNNFSILKLSDLFKMEVAKIVHSHFTNNLPSKFFTQKNPPHVQPEQPNRHAIPYTFPDTQLYDCNDALSIKELKFGIISHQKFKIHQQDYLKTNTKNIYYQIIKIYTAALPCFCFK